jgi:hypothetical protein
MMSRAFYDLIGYKELGSVLRSGHIILLEREVL